MPLVYSKVSENTLKLLNNKRSEWIHKNAYKTRKDKVNTAMPFTKYMPLPFSTTGGRYKTVLIFMSATLPVNGFTYCFGKLYSVSPCLFSLVLSNL